MCTKNTKLARRGGTCLYAQLLGRLRRENLLNPGGRGCGEPRCIIALQPGQQERNSNNNNSNNSNNTMWHILCKTRNAKNEYKSNVIKTYIKSDQKGFKPPIKRQRSTDWIEKQSFTLPQVQDMNF